MRLDPARLGFDLQSSRFILLQYRQQPVISVLTNAPSGRVWLSRVIEYPKQYQRVAGVTFGEIRCVEAEAERDAAHQRVTESGHRIHVFQHGLAESWDVRRKKVRAVHRDACARHRVIVSEFRAEIDSFFQVGPP